MKNFDHRSSKGNEKRSEAVRGGEISFNNLKNYNHKRKFDQKDQRRRREKSARNKRKRRDYLPKSAPNHPPNRKRARKNYQNKKGRRRGRGGRNQFSNQQIEFKDLKQKRSSGRRSNHRKKSHLRMDRRIVDIPKTVRQINKTEHVVKFFIGGVTQESLTNIPKLYNLGMLIRLISISLNLLVFQSLSLVQSTLFTITEICFLAFVVYVQLKCKALSSKLILLVRVLESITLGCYGILCILYSSKKSSLESLGYKFSHFCFVLFVFTLGVEYFLLVFTLGSKVYEVVREKMFKKNSKEEKTGLINTADYDSLSLEERRKRAKYWQNHQFVVLGPQEPGRNHPQKKKKRKQNWKVKRVEPKISFFSQNS